MSSICPRPMAVDAWPECHSFSSFLLMLLAMQSSLTYSDSNVPGRACGVAKSRARDFGLKSLISNFAMQAHSACLSRKASTGTNRCWHEQIGLAFAAFLYWTVAKINVGGPQEGETEALDEISKASSEELENIYKTIQEGAAAFLWYENPQILMLASPPQFSSLQIIMVAIHGTASGC
jgi:hypothetical protein